MTAMVTKLFYMFLKSSIMFYPTFPIRGNIVWAMKVYRGNLHRSRLQNLLLYFLLVILATLFPSTVSWLHSLRRSLLWCY